MVKKARRSVFVGRFLGKGVFWYLAVATGGLLAGAVFNFLVCWELLHLEYPWNTFLFNPAVRGSDLFNHLAAARTLDPYHAPLASEAVYPPFAYLLLYPLSLLAHRFGGGAAYAVFAVGGAALCCRFGAAALDSFRSWRRWAVAVAVFAASYPLWMALDRGNLDLWCAPLIGLGLLFLDRRPTVAALLLAIPIAVKLSPAVFLVVPLLRGNWKPILVCGLAVAAFELAALAAFGAPPLESLAGWREQLANFSAIYVAGNSGLLYNASVFPLFKAACVLLGRPDFVRFYELFAAALGAAMLAAAWRFLPRRRFPDAFAAAAIFILCPHFSMDYRLLYLLIPAFLLLNSPPENPKFALRMAVLLALISVPKQYWFFGDSWVGIGTFANPVLILATFLYATAACAGARVTSGKSLQD